MRESISIYIYFFYFSGDETKVASRNILTKPRIILRDFLRDFDEDGINLSFEFINLLI